MTAEHNLMISQGYYYIKSFDLWRLKKDLHINIVIKLPEKLDFKAFFAFSFHRLYFDFSANFSRNNNQPA